MRRATRPSKIDKDARRHYTIRAWVVFMRMTNRSTRSHHHGARISGLPVRKQTLRRSDLRLAFSGGCSTLNRGLYQRRIQTDAAATQPYPRGYQQ
jgi:hypothetical protein